MNVTKVRTAEEAISATTERLISDIADFACKRDAALSILRQTTIDLDDIHVIHYNKNIKRGYKYNHEYEKRLHEKRLQLLKKELQK